MKLFRRRLAPLPTPPADATPSEPAAVEPISGLRERWAAKLIALSEEQKRLLKEPLDARVERILHEISADKAAVAKALEEGRIIQFPPSNPCSVADAAMPDSIVDRIF